MVSKGRLDLILNLISDVAELLEKVFPECKVRIKNMEEKMVGTKDKKQWSTLKILGFYTKTSETKKYKLENKQTKKTQNQNPPKKLFYA